jgi:recombinational DNA repair protein RecR
MYIKENIPDKNIKITRLSKWLPNSGYIEYADEITLINAFKWRN